MACFFILQRQIPFRNRIPPLDIAANRAVTQVSAFTDNNPAPALPCGKYGVINAISNMDALIDVQAVAAEVFAILDTGDQIQPFSSRSSSFNLDDAYRATAIVRKMREARGELPVGRKIGFTNRAAWVDYNVQEPMWGYLYDRTGTLTRALPVSGAETWTTELTGVALNGICVRFA